MEHIVLLLTQATVLAAIVVPSIEAVRKQIPSIDGWRVLVAGSVIALGFAGLSFRPTTLAGAIDAFGVAVLAVVLAVGGDAWVGKVAGKVAGK